MSIVIRLPKINDVIELVKEVCVGTCVYMCVCVALHVVYSYINVKFSFHQCTLPV